MKRTIVSAGTVLAATLALTGCTGGSDTVTTSAAPTGSATSGTSSTPGTTTSSPSASVPAGMLDFAEKPAAKATSTTFFPSGAPATLFIAPVRGDSQSSLLTFWITTSQSADSPISADVASSWPKLVDPAGQKAYGVTTYSGTPGTSNAPKCVCTPTAVIYSTPRVMTAAYPALPAGLTKITVRLKGFADVVVPVTR